MECLNFKELRAIETDKIMFDLTNEFRAVSSSPVYAAYAVSYVIVKANSLTSCDLSSLDSFLASGEVNENISCFVKEMLGKTWDIVTRVANRYDVNAFKALLLYNHSYQIKSCADGTPTQLSKLACRVLEISDGEYVADYCTGQGSFIVEAFNDNTNVFFYGNEINLDRASVALMRADILGKNINIEIKNTFALDMYNLSFDKIFSNYSFAVRLSENEVYGNNALQYLNTYLPSRKKTVSSDWLFNTVIINTLKENGKAVAIMTPNSLFNLSDKDIRQFFIEKGFIEAIVALPSKLFESTSINTYLVVFSHGNTSVKFVDANDCFVSGRRINELSDENISEILSMLKSTTKKSKSVSKEQIKENDYNLDAVKYFEKEIVIKDSIRFSDVIKSITRGAQLKAADIDNIVTTVPTPYQYLTLTDIQNGAISDSLTYITEIADNLRKYCVSNRQLIISKSGTPIKVAVADISENTTILANGNLYIIEIDESKANPFFLKTFFDSATGKAVLGKSSVGIAVPTISLEALKNISIPCPPLEKQNEIAAKYLAARDELALAKVRVKKIESKLNNIYEESVGE